jgi:hypothetical protein
VTLEARMLTISDIVFIVIGMVVAGLTQFTRIMTASRLPLARIALATSALAAIANFFLSGVLIYFNVPIIFSMFLGALTGFVGGELVFNSMAKRLEKQLGLELGVDREKE